VTLEERVAKLELLLEAGEAEIAQLRGENERLRARVAELERRLSENSRNSNQPPSGDAPSDRQARPKDEPSGRKPGGQPGHKPHKRNLLPPGQVTRTENCFPDECRRCGKGLPQRADAEPLQHQVIDVPSIEPDVTEYRLHRVECACGETTCAELPCGVPKGMLGPRLLGLVALLTGNCHVSRRKVQVLLRDILNVNVSLGALSESEEMVSDALGPAVEEARLHALAAKVKHADGTTWYQRSVFRALWTLATSAVTVFTIVESATKEALHEWLGDSGILVSDRGTQLGFWAMKRRQICWAHLVRKFAAYSEHAGQAGEIGALLLLATRTVLREWHRVRDGTITRETFRRRTAKGRQLIELLLDAGAALPDGIAGSCRDVLAHRAALWTFAHEEGVEPTNNHAERELRGFVLWRKTSLGSQSARGDRFAANIKSVVHTCRKQRRHVWDYITRAIQADLRGRSAPSLLGATP
jgi:transposase